MFKKGRKKWLIAALLVVLSLGEAGILPGKVSDLAGVVLEAVDPAPLPE